MSYSVINSHTILVFFSPSSSSPSMPYSPPSQITDNSGENKLKTPFRDELTPWTKWGAGVSKASRRVGKCQENVEGTKGTTTKTAYFLLYYPHSAPNPFGYRTHVACKVKAWASSILSSPDVSSRYDVLRKSLLVLHDRPVEPVSRSKCHARPMSVIKCISIFYSPVLTSRCFPVGFLSSPLVLISF